MQQVKHAIETGDIQTADQLPSIRQMAEDLLINRNTVARAYRDLAHEGVIELKHGSGAFVREAIVPRSRLMNKAQVVIQSALDQLSSLDMSEEQIRRLIENELVRRQTRRQSRKTYA